MCMFVVVFVWVSVLVFCLDFLLLFDVVQQQVLVCVCWVFDVQLLVLLQGEIGIGKEVFVCVLYWCSICVDKLFVVVNCVVLLEGLIEVELFGYEEGVFIGVCKIGNIGLLWQVQGGVLFLDEIGDMFFVLQL